LVFNSSYFFASCVLIQWVLRFIVKCESVCSPNQKFNSSETMNVSLVRGALAPLSWQRFFSRVVNWCVSTSFIIHNDSGRMNRWSFTQPSILSLVYLLQCEPMAPLVQQLISPHVGRLCVSTVVIVKSQLYWCN